MWGFNQPLPDDRPCMILDSNSDQTLLHVMSMEPARWCCENINVYQSSRGRLCIFHGDCFRYHRIARGESQV
jgi:hypothetical protein